MTALARFLAVTLILSLSPAIALAQDCDPSAEEVSPDCTLGEILRGPFEQVFPLDEEVGEQAPEGNTLTGQEASATRRAARFKAIGGRASDAAGEEVVDANRATTAPDPFASQLHASYQDFLNLLSFAVNEVQESEDGQSLIVRLNPLRHGRNLLGLSLTLTKPSVGDLVSNSLTGDGKSEALAQIEEKMSDLDDQTWSLSYSWATPECSEGGSSWCWGRQPESYREILSSVLAKVAETMAATSTSQARETVERELLNQIRLVPTTSGGPSSMRSRLLDYSPENRERVLSLIRSLASQQIETTQINQALFKESGFENLASLIDNQPQLAISGSYRNLGLYGGPDESALSLEFQFGFENINSLLRGCDGETREACAAKKLRNLALNGISTDKFVLTASYKERDEFKLSDLGLEDPVDDFTPIDKGDSDELQAKLQWGRRLNTSVGVKNTRFDVSFEGIRTRGDVARTENRWVGTATLTVPLGDQMSIPVSLNYANKPEFLVDQNESLGMHFGLSWRLPFDQ